MFTKDELEDDLFYEEEENQEYDNLSTHVCEECGARLTKDEWISFESVCSECIWNDSQGQAGYEEDEDTIDDEID